MLRSSACGFGTLALSALMQDEADAASVAGPLAPKPSHFPARAKRVIFLFMHGGPSQVDTFDYKPQLIKDHGKPLPFNKPRVFSSQTGNLLKSPWEFRQYGESGAWVSDLFPNVAKHVDDLCIINGMHGSNSRHGAALLELHTGSDTFVRPSMGAWITYGLGTENRSLPGFITICPTLTHGGATSWGSSFLPADYQGTAIGNAGIPSDKAKIPFIENADHLDLNLQRQELDFAQSAEPGSAERDWSGFDAGSTDQLVRTCVSSADHRTGTSGNQLTNLKTTQKAYGLDQPQTRNFGRQCLMARRFIERGVRFVQCTHSYKWDQHGGLRADHARNAMEVDQPISALLADLKERGLLDETLVLWGGEFGRTPVAQGDDGRDHNPQGYTMWLAGGGVKAGIRYGATDEYGYFAVENKVHLHDLHATILHLLGLDHLRLTYKYAGRDFRLTDVHGRVVDEILA